MPSTKTSFTDRAPCGRTVDGERVRDRDEDEGCVVTDEMFYACGCRDIRHEYHDGGVSRKVVRHDGKVLVDEFTAGA